MWTVLLGVLLLLSKSQLVDMGLMADCWISCLYYSQSHVLLSSSFTFLLRHATLWVGLRFMVNIFNPKSTLCDCILHNALLFIVHFSNCILKFFTQYMKNTKRQEWAWKNRQKQINKVVKAIEQCYCHCPLWSTAVQTPKHLAYRTSGTLS